MLKQISAIYAAYTENCLCLPVMAENRFVTKVSDSRSLFLKFSGCASRDTIMIEAVVQMCSVKKVFSEISQNS